PRFLTPAEAAALAERVPGAPARVGLFVEPREEDVAAVLAEMKLDALQIYAAPGILAALRPRFGLPVWRAVPVAGRDDLPSEAGGADRLLLEAKSPPEATRPGGNAARFDWTLLRGWRAPAAWMLAGGLTPANVAAAVAATNARAVDVSSGVERAPGVKDPSLIRAFIANARAAG
ncbi:MAG: phosphoribosylanthranilate isomerase, partial [Pseudomonadota bacterium]|nr:phosphoribosylanthranilate isomerase [Pseudomonadota bacterium]